MDRTTVKRRVLIFGTEDRKACVDYLKEQADASGVSCTFGNAVTHLCSVVSGTDDAVKAFIQKIKEDLYGSGKVSCIWDAAMTDDAASGGFHFPEIQFDTDEKTGSEGYRYLTGSGAGSVSEAAPAADPDASGTEHAEGEEALRRTIADLKKRKIGAVKDFGGFHFIFLPDMSEPARRLRGFKKRKHKPFAVMFPDLETIRQYCRVSETEERLLTSPVHPIVLLRKIYGSDRKPVRDFAWEICGESYLTGAILPTGTLQKRLSEELGPLVVTSGNRGGESIVVSDDDMLRDMKEGCPDFILTDEHVINFPLEDSIFQVVETETGQNGKREIVQVIRRARGMTPVPVELPEPLLKDTYAAGGDRDNVFALGSGSTVFLSPHIGDLSGIYSRQLWDRSIGMMEYYLGIHPERAVADCHPSYESTQDAEQRFSVGGNSSGHVLKVQHHKAHIASVIAEHHLEGPVIGIAMDGSGYGDDGVYWGSEFMLCDPDHELEITYEKKKEKTLHAIPMNDVFDGDANRTRKMVRRGHFLRMGHLRPVKLLGGDMSSRDAMQSLICYMIDAEDRQLIWEHYSSDEILDPDMHQVYEIALAANSNTHMDASMGRLFDAAAAQLGISLRNTYEGECPERLEFAANRADLKWKYGIYTRENPLNGRYPLRFVMNQEDDVWIADGPRLIGDLRMALDGGVPADELALEFHDAVAEMIVSICEKISWEAGENGIQTHTVVLSGGTFCNRVLLQRVIPQLTDRGFQVYLNEKVPAGDGGITFGQLYLADRDSGRETVTELKTEEKPEGDGPAS